MNPDVITALLNAGLIDMATADIMRRQQDENAARAWAETLVNEASQAGLSAQQQRLLDLVSTTEGRPTAAQLNAFWAGENGLLWQALESAITRVATERASFAAVTAGGIDTFALVNQQVIQWVENYYANGTDPGSVGSLNATSRQQFADAFTRWQRGDVPFSQAEGLDGLIELLTPVFGPNRAEMIGITETTRVFVEAQRLAEANNPYTVAFRWLTSADEAVCPICGPMHGQIRRKNEGYAGGVDLPAHVRCRCHEVPETEATLQQPLPPEERFVFNG
jgi:SPP1 gp7 family putative phage head morphogenesis protein